MQIFIRKPRNLIFLLSVLIISGNLYAQDVNTMYYMRGIPQIYQLNPAIQPDCNFFFGIPGVSPLRLQVENDFGLEDVLQYDPVLDSLVTPFHSTSDYAIGEEEFLNRLKDMNSLNTELSTSLLSFGYRNKKTFITIDIRERFSLGFDYSKDFLRLPIVGPDEGEIFDMGLGIDMSLFNEMSLGISQNIGDKLTIGVRGKLLFGQANVNTSDLNIHLETSKDAILVQNNINIQTSAPYLTDYVAFATAAPIATITKDFENFDIDIPTTQEITGMVLNTNNLGFGVDIGANYRVFDWLQVNASVVDFGAIKWKDGMINLSNTSSYTFEGIEVDMGNEEFFDDFLDTLTTTFDNFTTTPAEYRTTLPTKVFIGAAAYPLRFISFGALSRTDFINGDIRQQFTFSTNIYPIRMLSTSFSYSIIDGTYKNLGLGVALKLLPLNIYVITDTGPSIYFWPPEARMFNLKAGVNFMFGNPYMKKKKAKVYDMPLVD
ncbi:MAG: hypothetical protein KAS71_05970 [Bacteroidales bacterium]|nr:hypothetical protein [Bacteroidales bacterium]